MSSWSCLSFHPHFFSITTSISESRARGCVFGQTWLTPLETFLPLFLRIRERWRRPDRMMKRMLRDWRQQGHWGEWVCLRNTRSNWSRSSKGASMCILRRSRRSIKSCKLAEEAQVVFGWVAVNDDSNRVRHMPDLLIALMLMGPSNLATLMCAPAAPLIIRDFGSSSQIKKTLIVSIWELGEACGPLLVGPMSEIFGRAPIYHIMNASFCVFSIACAVSRDTDMLIAFRFLNGFSVASIVLNPPIIGDLFVTEERGSAMSIMGLAPLLGPVLGPIVGGYLAQSIGWRWVFGLAAILAGVVECAFIVCFTETYKVRILERKASRLREARGNMSYQSLHGTEMTTKSLLTIAVIRPFRMLFASPIIFLLSAYVAVVFGYTYILFTTITDVFESVYGFSTGSASLTFIGLGKDCPEMLFWHGWLLTWLQVSDSRRVRSFARPP